MPNYTPYSQFLGDFYEYEKNKTLSVSFAETRVGIKSGSRVDKSDIFTVFYGEELKNAPMIKEAPITHACKLDETVDFGDTHYLFIGEIIETCVNEEVFTNTLPDIEKVRPITFYYDNFYQSAGEQVAQAYKIGKKYGKK